MVSLDPRGRIQAKQLAIVFSVISALFLVVITLFRHDATPGRRDGICRQPPKLAPLPHSPSNFLTREYRNKSMQVLGGAVRIPTESYDDMSQDPLEDSRFEVFSEFHQYLNSSFPIVTENVETVNTYGLLYTIPGLDDKLEPLLLMAHQDVVPVDPTTIDKWTHEPYSGYFDGDLLWGRGSSDTKSSLIAILEAVEALLSESWAPQRTLLLSFGFDEELDGSRGAEKLSNVIMERYGKYGLYMIIDEGGGMSNEHGTLIAFPEVAEKGYTDVELSLSIPGGHSSTPPDHTGIGIMSEIVVALEDEQNAFIPALNGDSAVAMMFGCLAEHAPDVSEEEHSLWDNLVTPAARARLARILGSGRQTRQLVQTTQAIDIIHGGNKINALPDRVDLVVNYRIDVDSSVECVTDRFTSLAQETALARNLSMSINGVTVSEGGNGQMYIKNVQSIDPSPVSPFTIDDDAYRALGCVTRYVFEEVLGHDNVIIAPALATGNTDTSHYWNLCTRIYRFTPATVSGNAHTVNEYTSADSHIAIVAWYHQLIQEASSS